MHGRWTSARRIRLLRGRVGQMGYGEFGRNSRSIVDGISTDERQLTTTEVHGLAALRDEEAVRAGVDERLGPRTVTTSTMRIFHVVVVLGSSSGSVFGVRRNAARHDKVLSQQGKMLGSRETKNRPLSLVVNDVKLAYPQFALDEPIDLERGQCPDLPSSTGSGGQDRRPSSGPPAGSLGCIGIRKRSCRRGSTPLLAACARPLSRRRSHSESHRRNRRCCGAMRLTWSR